MKIKKITIEAEELGESKTLVWTPYYLADYWQIIGGVDGMLSEFGYHESQEDDVVDDE